MSQSVVGQSQELRKVRGHILAMDHGYIGFGQLPMTFYTLQGDDRQIYRGAMHDHQQSPKEGDNVEMHFAKGRVVAKGQQQTKNEDGSVNVSKIEWEQITKYKLLNPEESTS